VFCVVFFCFSLCVFVCSFDCLFFIVVVALLCFVLFWFYGKHIYFINNIILNGTWKYILLSCNQYICCTNILCE